MPEATMREPAIGVSSYSSPRRRLPPKKKTDVSSGDFLRRLEGYCRRFSWTMDPGPLFSGVKSRPAWDKHRILETNVLISRLCGVSQKLDASRFPSLGKGDSFTHLTPRVLGPQMSTVSWLLSDV